LQQGAKNSRARFIDEPLALNFQHQPDNQILIEFESEGQVVQAVTIAAFNFYHEIARALQDFHHQLIDLNPQLSNESEVRGLSIQIEKLS
jgi:hypothetical protein